MDTGSSAKAPDAAEWERRFLDDLAVVRSSNTVRAYEFDLDRWLAFCDENGADPFQVKPRMAIDFIRKERERTHSGGKAVGARSTVRRLSAIRQWYEYLKLAPDVTGVRMNPIPRGTAARAAAGLVASRPALLSYDTRLPEVLSGEEMEEFIGHLVGTKYRDRAMVYLMKDGGLRISEVLNLRLSEVDWSRRSLKIRPSKGKIERNVPISVDAVSELSNYVRLERPKGLDHDYVFVNLGRRGFDRPFTYPSWAAVCRKARVAAGVDGVHAHAFRHTFATNMREAGMELDALQRILGHAHMDTTMIYNHVRDGRAWREYQEAMAVQAADRVLRKDRREG